MDLEALAREVVDCAYHVHCDLGPGLLESVYETVLAKRLTERWLRVERQKAIPIAIDGLDFEEGFKADLLVEERLLVELKSQERLAPVHGKQTLTYLRLLKLPLGLLINFGGTDVQGRRAPDCERAHRTRFFSAPHSPIASRSFLLSRLRVRSLLLQR